MRNYEGMFIIKSDMAEDSKKNLFNQIGEVITKNNGKIETADIWAEKKRLYFTLKRQNEGTYYLVNFSIPPEEVTKLYSAYKINEDILRVMITVKE